MACGTCFWSHGIPYLAKLAVLVSIVDADDAVAVTRRRMAFSQIRKARIESVPLRPMMAATALHPLNSFSISSTRCSNVRSGEITRGSLGMVIFTASSPVSP
jgi:hypothetical protein